MSDIEDDWREPELQPGADVGAVTRRAPPIFTLTKTTNTFSSRHHIRVFDPALRYDGVTVLTASSTQDIGIAFSSKQKTFIHVIDQYIDNERSKVVNDLEFTGCVQAMELVPRPWAPQDAYNSTGDRLRTDGAIAVLRIGDCSHPRTTPDGKASPPSRFERITRDTMLTLRNDVWRGNVGYQSVTGTIWLRNYLVHKDDLKPETGAWQKSDVSGAEFKGAGSVPTSLQPSARIGGSPTREITPAPTEASAEGSHRWDPPRYEIALQGGYLNYPTTRFESVGAFLVPESPDAPTWDVGFRDAINGGWSAGISFTANTWRWVSNEFGYHYQRGKLLISTYFADLGAENEEGTFLPNRHGACRVGDETVRVQRSCARPAARVAVAALCRDRTGTRVDLPSRQPYQKSARAFQSRTAKCGRAGGCI
ncbi:MAG: LssY C-terminal domain-containing protein [Bryobacteraceae bacterium]